MTGIPRLGKMSRGIVRTAKTPPNITATSATTTDIGRRMANETRFILSLWSAWSLLPLCPSNRYHVTLECAELAPALPFKPLSRNFGVRGARSRFAVQTAITYDFGVRGARSRFAVQTAITYE